jgi:class 3 adenylate cyclase
MRSLSGMDEAVCGQGGVMRCFTGDAIMAVFGTPVPFEDTQRVARRSRCCGGLRQPVTNLRSNTDCGHNSNRPQYWGAIVGRCSAAGVTVLGDTANVAARLQAVA